MVKNIGVEYEEALEIFLSGNAVYIMFNNDATEKLVTKITDITNQKNCSDGQFFYKRADRDKASIRKWH